MAKAERVLFPVGQEKNEKKPQAYRLTVCATGSGSVAAIKDGIHAHKARVIRQSPPFLRVSCRKALTRRAPCACGRGFPAARNSRTGSGGLCEPREHCNTFRAVCMCFPADGGEFEAIASMSLLVLFSSVRKARIFSFAKEGTCPCPRRTRKERKETANVPFDHLCDRQRFGGGYKRRHPRSQCSRDPSIAAPFANIMPESAHAARALRLRARTSHSQLRPARRMLACRAKREQTTVGSRVYILSSR